MAATVRKLTPVLIVDEIEPCVPFWVERAGFTVATHVPHEEKIGFALLVKDGIEVMYQTRASIEHDIPGAAPAERGRSTALFVEVGDLAAFERAMQGADAVFPRRRTFYGTEEIGVREPGGHVVVFAQPTSG